MQTRDARGEPVSNADTSVLQHYETALERFQTYVGDPVAAIDLALAEDPDFVLGHVFRATMLLLTSEARYLPEARSSVAAAEKLAKWANRREQGLTRAARAWLQGDWSAACQAWEAVLVEHPRDAFAVQAAHLSDFLLGDALNLRDRPARVLPRWDRELPGYSYLLGMHAFGLEECNQYPEAERTARAALELDPVDGWTVHAAVHVMEMQGRYEEGIRFLAEREQDWAPDNGFAFHNWWHLALFQLERGDYPAALALYDRAIYAEPADLSMQMLDASALLWRLHLYGVDTGQRWAELAAVWQRKAADENGYYAFNDDHALMAYLGSGDHETAKRLLADMEWAAKQAGVSNRAMTREVGLPVARGLMAFANERYDEVIEVLAPVRGIAHRFGGSHAQRDLIYQSLVEAALRARRTALAEHLINERRLRKPHTPLTRRFASLAQPAAGAAPSASQRVAAASS